MRFLLVLILVVLIGGNDESRILPLVRGQNDEPVYLSEMRESALDVATPDRILGDSGLHLRVVATGVVVEAEFIRGRPDVVSPRTGAPPEGEVDGLYNLGPAVIQAADVAYQRQGSFLFAFRERVILLLAFDGAVIWRNTVTQAVDHLLPLQGQLCLPLFDAQIWHQISDSTGRLMRAELPAVFRVTALAEILGVFDKVGVAAKVFHQQFNSLGFCLNDSQAEAEPTVSIGGLSDLTQGDAAIGVNNASQISQDKLIHDSSVLYQGEKVNGEEFYISIYCCKNDPGGAYCGATASGVQVAPGMVACSPHWDLGTRFLINEQYVATCTDRGGAVTEPNHLDVFFDDCGIQEDPDEGTGWEWLQRIGTQVEVEVLP